MSSDSLAAGDARPIEATRAHVRGADTGLGARHQLRQVATAAARQETSLWVVEIVAACLEQDRFHAAATTVATQLAARLDCERVSIGLLQRGHAQVKVISRSASLDGRVSLARTIGSAMDEALDQDATVLHPSQPDARSQLTRAHSELARLHGAAALCTVPFSHRGELVGAITFEHADSNGLPSPSRAGCEAVVSLVGPILYEKFRQERWIGARLRTSAREFIGRFLGPRHALLKLNTAVLFALVGLMFVPGEYRISAQAALEGKVRRVVVSPFDGYVAEALVRAGDTVIAGELLARLDDKDLALQRLKLASQLSQLRKEYREAMAELDGARVSILKAQLERAGAELALTDEQLIRAGITAPFDGIVVRGDLTQLLGVPIERGDTLFEIAPLESYRVMLQVDERDVGRLKLGQPGHLALVGLPGDRLRFRVDRITPVSTASQGRNYFAVEARLEETPDLLRPGMRGIAKIDAGERTLGWIWTHKFFEWLRLWAWSRLPWS